ncbi:rod-binding protein [Telmatospirillum siberiense]|uniref:Chemotactic signal-response protein chel n=1 Tax=Telmatospirillum siberiense TaxID=382514 RepID=A0A2N3PZZ0_9PROT|nr:rod-binding protein [Telmatospirillum siberiense]PKU25965.1 chemotactic signal-response protein chel [Telmatospirillum siberiense]
MLTDPTQGMASQALATRAMNAQALAAQEVSDQSGATTGSSSHAPIDMVAAKKAAQSFESVFLSQMLGHMFEGVGKNTLFGGGAGEDMFKPMLLDEYGKLMAQKGGIGIADAVMRTLIKQQEKTQ